MTDPAAHDGRFARAPEWVGHPTGCLTGREGRVERANHIPIIQPDIGARSMRRIPGSIGVRFLAVGLVAAVACQDRVASPVSIRAQLPTKTDGDSASASRGDVITGRFVLSVRGRPSEGNSNRIIAADTGDYVATIGDDDDLNASLASPEYATQLRLIAVAGMARRQGQWAVDAGQDSGGVERSITFAAGAGGPPSETEFRRGGILVARIATSWTRTAGAWRMRDRSIALYRDSLPSRTIEWSFGEPELVKASGRRTSPALSLLPRTAPAVASEDVVGGSCEAEAGGVSDAMETFAAAAFAFDACRGWSCGAALYSLYSASRALDAASGRYDRCQYAT